MNFVCSFQCQPNLNVFAQGILSNFTHFMTHICSQAEQSHSCAIYVAMPVVYCLHTRTNNRLL
eukprot:c18157_g2_i1 orf=149-337(-)